MNTYSDDNKPRSGTAKKLFSALKTRGFKVIDLHYNPNLWGMAREDGWGTWAAQLEYQEIKFFCFLGFAQDTKSIYLEKQIAPYSLVFLTECDETLHNFAVSCKDYYL